MMAVKRMRVGAAVVAALVVTSCASQQPHDDGPGSARIPQIPGDAVPRPEARSRYGNAPVYEVLGKRYTVMKSSANFSERGVASWYGKKFHGRLTSNREVYDMYAMTAAHKSLPLPTYVSVRNLRNNKSVVVRVNDRGPFVANRVIDLSYAAALKLDMVRAGTGLVEVTAINVDANRTQRSTVNRPAPEQTGPIVTPPLDQPTRAVSHSAAASGGLIYVQVGAFGDVNNAKRRIIALHDSGIANAFIHEEMSVDKTLYRVRIGPVDDVVQYDVLVEELFNIGITDPYLITE